MLSRKIFTWLTLALFLPLLQAGAQSADQYSSDSADYARYRSPTFQATGSERVPVPDKPGEAQGTFAPKSLDEYSPEERVALEQELSLLNDEIAKIQTDLAVKAASIANTQLQIQEARNERDQAKVNRLVNERADLERELTQMQLRLQEANAELDGVQESLAVIENWEQYLAPLRVGEIVEVTVVEDESLNGIYPIRDGGHITIPNAGRVFVAGLNLKRAETAIRALLGENLIRDATVLVERVEEEQRTVRRYVGTIFCVGNFRRAGLYRIPVGETPTLVKTIISAGGVNDVADLTKVAHIRIVDGISNWEEYDIKGIYEGEPGVRDINLLDGDIIYIPGAQAIGKVYVTGNVEAPGEVQIPYDGHLTAYTAILQSNGFSRWANRRRVYVLRDAGGGQKKQLPVDITYVQRGLQPDVVLEPNDIVVVPEKFWSW